MSSPVWAHEELWSLKQPKLGWKWAGYQEANYSGRLIYPWRVGRQRASLGTSLGAWLGDVRLGSELESGRPLSASASETVFLSKLTILGYAISVFRNSKPLSALLP